MKANVRLRRVGGAYQITIPPRVVKALNIKAKDFVMLTIRKPS